MSNTIQGSNPAPSTPSAEPSQGGALPVSPHGAAEAVIDQVVQQLEDQRMQTRELQREVRREQRAAEKRQLRNERKAAAWKLAGGLVNATGQAVQGGLGVASASQGDAAPDAAGGSAAEADGDGGASAGELQGWGQVSQATGAGLSSVAGFVASHEESDAKAAGQEAANLREVAQEHGEAADRMERLQDKAMSHRERIADARLQAQLRSSR